MNLPKKEIQFLIGCVLGDGHLRIDKACINPRFKCDHGPKQAEYCEWKKEMIQSLSPKFKIWTRKTPDKRNGKFYTSATLETCNKKELLQLYHMFYKDKKKVISKGIYSYFNELSLAVMFMDDGYKTSHSIMISTNCFNKIELEDFIDFLFDKFKIRFNIMSDNKIYLPAKFYNTFKELVIEHIHPTMLYKLPK
jgi:hypothetical protein